MDSKLEKKIFMNAGEPPASGLDRPIPIIHINTGTKTTLNIDNQIMTEAVRLTGIKESYWPHHGSAS